MSSLVEDLQSECVDESTSVSQLLRKARVLSVKLEANELEVWLGHELSGYPADTEVPEYRQITGQPKRRNPHYGLQPILMSDNFSAFVISSRDIKQPISELEALDLESGDSLHMEYPNEIKMALMKQMPFPMEPILLVSHVSIVGILDAVRNTILDWVLELERNGVLGEGLRFTARDKQKAVPANYQITNNIGSMHGSQIQQLSDNSSQMISDKTDIGALASILLKIVDSVESLDLDEKTEQKLKDSAAAAAQELESPQSNTSVAEEFIQSVRSILDAAAGNVLAAGYLHQLGSVLG